MHQHRITISPLATSPIHRLPAGLKLFVAVALVLTVSLLPPAWALWLTPAAMVILIMILLSRLPLFPLCKRLLLLEPFVLGVALMALFSPQMEDRLSLFFFLVARCTLALLTMLVFTATTPFAEVLRILRTLRIPLLLVTTLALMHRYLFVLADESMRMRRARQSRTFNRRRGNAWRTLSTVIAQLFIRASERAGRIYDAMRARGWDA